MKLSALKSYLVTTTLSLFLVCAGSVGWAADPIDFTNPYARMNITTMGAGVAASCSSTQQGDTTGTTTGPYLAYSSGNQYTAMSFTANADYTIYHVTVKLRRIGTGGGGTITAALCTNNATPNPDEPTATCTNADATMLASHPGTGGTEETFDFAAGYSVTNGSRYWFRLHTDTIGDDSNYIQNYYNTTGSEITLRADSTPTWAAQDSACIGYHTLSSCK